MKRLLQVLFLIAITPGAMAASFNCDKARSPSEHMICVDAELSALDDQLAVAAAEASARASDPKAFKREQVQAWQERQKCTERACVKNWYDARLSNLRSGANAAPIRTVAVPSTDPGMEIRELGSKIGFDVPLTKDDFMRRYGDKGGRCFNGRVNPGIVPMNKSVVSECQIDSRCEAYVEGLKCRAVRTGYDQKGQLISFQSTLNLPVAEWVKGTLALSKFTQRITEMSGRPNDIRHTSAGSTVANGGATDKVGYEFIIVATTDEGQTGVFMLNAR